MDPIKDGRVPIMLDRERHLLLSLNAIAEIQERYGDISKTEEKISEENGKGTRELIWMLKTLLNEGRDENEPEITLWKAGNLVHPGNINAVRRAIIGTFVVGLNVTEKDKEMEEESTNPN